MLLVELLSAALMVYVAVESCWMPLVELSVGILVLRALLLTQSHGGFARSV